MKSGGAFYQQPACCWCRFLDVLCRTHFMRLNSGSRLGPFEILAPLGAGGMGEVFRARDTKLGREVALKILPEAFASQPDRLIRFRREAQVLAALNHTSIA